MSDQQLDHGNPQGPRLARALVLLFICVLGALYALGLPTLVAVIGGATCSYVGSLAINKALSRRRVWALGDQAAKDAGSPLGLWRYHEHPSIYCCTTACPAVACATDKVTGS